MVETMSIDVAQHLGYRSSQEDRYSSSLVGNEYCIISVFDGFGGDDVSDYLSFFFHCEVRSALKKEATTEGALNAAVHIMEEKLVGKHIGQGSTPCSVMIQGKTIISTNVGDSRAVLCRQGGAALDLTRDHTPYDPIEKDRLEKAGLSTQRIGEFGKDGKPIPGKGCVRINHGITLARAIGYSSDRPGITPEPEIKIFDLMEDDEFVVAACDGIWDVMSSEDVVCLITQKQTEDAERKKIPSLVIQEALSHGAIDNLTVVILWLK